VSRSLAGDPAQALRDRKLCELPGDLTHKSDVKDGHEGAVLKLGLEI
jgi:hypothetical protein